MIIYNTTYNSDNSVAVAFIKWLRTRFIPQAIQSGDLKEPRLAHLMVENDGKSNSFSLQFTVENVDTLEKWYKEYGAELIREMECSFNQKVVGFTTIMTVMDIQPIMNSYERIIIGIDPGTNVMGYGILGINNKKLEIIAMGVIKLNKFDSHYLRLRRIFERVTGLINQYLPDEMAIEAPFFGKNVQSMLKLGRAQGVAMAAALNRDIPIAEYEPRKIKLAITGNGAASKEQVAEMLRRTLSIPKNEMPEFLDATDALAAAVCHYYESSKPQTDKGCRSWKEFISKNPDKVKS